MLENNHKPEVSGHIDAQHKAPENLASTLWHDMMLGAQAVEKKISPVVQGAQAGFKEAEHLVIEPLFKNVEETGKAAGKVLLNTTLLGLAGEGLAKFGERIGRNLSNDKTLEDVLGRAVCPASPEVWHVAKDWLNKHSGVKDFLIDMASGLAATGVAAVTIETGPGAVVIGAATGALTHAALHKAFGDKVTAGNFVSGAIDGAAGVFGGMLEKAMAEKFAQLGAREALNSTLSPKLLPYEKHIANLFIQGAKETGAEIETLAKLGAKGLKIDKLLGHGTDFIRSNVYSNTLSTPATKIAEFAEFLTKRH